MDTMQDQTGKSEGDISLPAISSTLEKQKRILKELRNEAEALPKKLRMEDADETDEEMPQDVKIECQQAESEFKKLKFAFRDLQSQIKLLEFLENVPRGEWPSVESCDGESKRVRRSLKDAKAEASDLEDQLLQTLKQVQTRQETVENQLESLSQLVEEVTERAAEEKGLLQQRTEGALSALSGSGVDADNFQEFSKKQDEELKSAVDFLAQQAPLLRSMREQAESLSEKRRSLAERAHDARQELSRRTEEKLRNEKEQLDQVKWCESASRMLTELSGVSEQSFVDNCWTLALDTTGSGPSATEGMTALLSLHFKPGPEVLPQRRLASASIDISTLEIKDLVSEAVQRNDASFLVSSVMERLKTHAPLFLEVEQLRHRYAIDWVPEEGILRAIFGDSAQIVCTLSVASGPLGTTQVELGSIEGVGDHPPLAEIKPPQEMPRISDWLDFLHETTKTL